MSTRGFLGFVADSTEKIAYNHCDSYPSGLGIDVLTWLRFAATDTAALREKVTVLRVVDGDAAPTDEDVRRLSDNADLKVSTQDPRDWYVLLRRTQGNPGAILQAGVILDGSDFPADSLFCEHGYLVDLDAMTFEAYAGFQRGTHDQGRFAKRESREEISGYGPVALVKSWPLVDLPSDREFLAALSEDDE